MVMIGWPRLPLPSIGRPQSRRRAASGSTLPWDAASFLVRRRGSTQSSHPPFSACECMVGIGAESFPTSPRSSPTRLSVDAGLPREDPASQRSRSPAAVPQIGDHHPSIRGPVPRSSRSSTISWICARRVSMRAGVKALRRQSAQTSVGRCVHEKHLLHHQLRQRSHLCQSHGRELFGRGCAIGCEVCSTSSTSA